MICTSHSPEETRGIAADLAKNLEPGTVLLLHGNLGLGKTCFAQGIAEGLGWEGSVTSPTFALIQEYGTRPPLVHMDLYRLHTAREVWDLGLEELFDTDAILLVEWSERCPELWPETAIHVTLSPLPSEENGRQIEISPARGRGCL